MVIQVISIGRTEFEVEVSSGLGPLRIWRAEDRRLMWAWVRELPMPRGLADALAGADRRAS